jgi:hypothetical protein
MNQLGTALYKSGVSERQQNGYVCCSVACENTRPASFRCFMMFLSDVLTYWSSKSVTSLV